MVHDFKDHVFHTREIEHFDDKFQAVLDGHPQVDVVLVVVLAPQHQIEVQVVWAGSVGLKMVYEIVEHLWRESLNIFNYEQNRSFPRIHIIFVEELLYAVKCLFLEDVGLHLLLLHDFGNAVVILALIPREELPFVLKFFVEDFLVSCADDFFEDLLTALFNGRR